MIYTAPYLSVPEQTSELGTFQVTSEKLIVSDPCYDLGTWCAGTLTNVKNGTWKGFVDRGKTDWGNRCWAVSAFHENFSSKTTRCTELMSFEVGVDSGQAGIFDAAEYHGGEDDYGDGGWYDQVCNLTLDSKLSAGVLDGGVVSSSGFGDGGYQCHVARDNGQIVGVKITFISSGDFVDNEEDF